MSTDLDHRGDWNYPTPIRFGWGRLQELPRMAAELGFHRPFLLTDRGLAERSPFQRSREMLATSYPELVVWTEAAGNPDETQVASALEAFRQGGCDSLVAVGGGSPLDVAKAVAILAHHPRDLFDFVDEGENFRRADPDRIPPLLAVPTTAGTGSEVGRVAVITDSQSRQKRLIFHPKLQPVGVLADPELTVELPPGLTAATGLDALAHNLEAFCSVGFHPMADGIALEGIRLIVDSLPKAYREPTDRTARTSMLAASIMGATAFQKGLGAVHSLAHSLGGEFGFHHGLLNGILMPYVLAFNRSHLGDRWKALETSFGADPIDALLELRQLLNVPHSLKELPDSEPLTSASDSLLEELARRATGDPSAGGNPRPLDDEAHLALLRAALIGDLGAMRTA